MNDLDTILSNKTSAAAMATTQGMVKVLTRDEIADVINGEGFDISSRTIRFWESRGYIRKPVRLGRHVVHTPDILDSIRALAATRPAAIRDLRKRVAPRHGRVVNVRTTDDVLVVSISYSKKSMEK